MIDKKYADYSWEKASALLNIDSPTGFTKKAAEFVKKEFSALGFPAEYTVKGGVLADLGGKDDNNALLLEAHTDTLGGMVAEVKSNGRLRITPLGGMNACNAETENVRIYRAKYMRARFSFVTLQFTLTAIFRLFRVLGTASKSLSTRT